MILSDFLFSRFNFSFVMELPFLKFIKYMFTVWSMRENAVKKDWSAQVILKCLIYGKGILRDAIDLGWICLSIVLLSEVDHMGRLAHWFLQVPNHEVLTLVNSKELAHSCSEFHVSELKALSFVYLSRSTFLVWVISEWGRWSVILEI